MKDKNRNDARQDVPAMHTADSYMEALGALQSHAPQGSADSEPHAIDGASRSGVPGRDFAPGESASGRRPNLDSNASGATLPGQADNVLGPPDRNEPNIGLRQAAMPEMQFAGGEGLSPADFARAPLAAGHARRSPGDGSSDTQHRGFFEKEAEVEEASLGPGILPTPLASSPTANPIRASDFARGFGENVPGQQDASPGNPVSRGPISPEQALGLGKERMRGDNLQADLQPSPMAGKPFPDTAGRTGSGDDASHQVVRPQIDVAPSLGADATGIAKSEFAKKVE